LASIERALRPPKRIYWTKSKAPKDSAWCVQRGATRERFMELVVEEAEKLPPTKEQAGEFNWRLFRKIVRAHTWRSRL
jgi:hypothetical protein